MSAPDRPELHTEEILRRLVARGVDFVIIGGVAAVLHGSPMSTFDLDICPATDPTNLDALGALLVEFGCRLKGVDESVPFVADGRTLRRIQVLTMRSDLGEIDVLTQPAGSRGYASLRRSADRFDVGDFSVLVASIDDLIAMKQAAGRPKDLAAVVELQAIRRLRGDA